MIADFALNHVRFRAAMHPTWCMADFGISYEVLLDATRIGPCAVHCLSYGAFQTKKLSTVL
jgi:hypothetical protein